MHISVSHWLDCIRQGFVVMEDDTVSALPGAVGWEGGSSYSQSVNPIVFSPMWGKGDCALCAYVCVCVWDVYGLPGGGGGVSASGVEPLLNIETLLVRTLLLLALNT